MHKQTTVLPREHSIKRTTTLAILQLGEERSPYGDKGALIELAKVTDMSAREHGWLQHPDGNTQPLTRCALQLREARQQPPLPAISHRATDRQ
jgi:hypothetical protein